MILPTINSLGLLKTLPNAASVAYVSIRPNSTNVALTLSWVATTPVVSEEAHVTWGVFRRFKTTVKIDPTVWSAAATAAGIPTAYPKLRDTITVNNITWTVHTDVDQIDNGLPYMLKCTYLDVQNDLCDTINIIPPVDSTDDYLSPTTTAGNDSSTNNLSCRIQFEKETTEDYQGIQFMRGYYKIYVQNLDDNLVIGTTVLATVGAYTGTVFRVIDNSNIEDIDELECVYCTIDP